ncbi:MAG: cytochrome c nitrite reductase pentaheme subunit [Candidatus Hinthialibacteria bacterium OLB16]|nr:MAG: cytochrome c nitrite reductase pentaheme subunit [Candidatus Hinthialibacteria bacterium OLB16]
MPVRRPKNLFFVLTLFSSLILLQPSWSKAFENDECLLCHGDASQWDLKDPAQAGLLVLSASHSGNVHEGLSCTDCHEGIEDLPHADPLPKVNCGSCHEDALAAYKKSVHGIEQGDELKGEAATCVSCHGTHDIYPTTDQRSKVHHHNLATTCIQCHQDQALIEKHKMGKQDNVQTYVVSVHGQSNLDDVSSRAATCNDCHGWHDIQKASSPESKVSRQMVAKTCGQCHEDVLEEYYGSVHGNLAKEGNPDVPVCTDCHGEHKISSVQDRESTVSKFHIAETCGKCHENQEIVKKYNIPISSPSTLYRQSVHGKALLSGSNPNAAACQDCHGYHSILGGSDPKSTVNRVHISATCGHCHQDIQKQFDESVHGQAINKGVREAPVCTDCHGEHMILGHLDPESPVYSTRLAKEVCARCHDSVVINRKYDLPGQVVDTFLRSYHGLAGRLGDTNVANCASCHGVHDILPSDDPKSSIYPDNLIHTCGKCHANVTPAFVAGMIHVSPKSTEKVVTSYVRSIYIFLIIVSIGGMMLHNLLILGRHIRDKYRSQKVIPHVTRFNGVALVQHLLLTLFFTVLVITGFSLSFPDSLFSQSITSYLGLGESHRSLVHRISGVGLILTTIWHVAAMLFTKRGRAEISALMLRFQDLRDLFRNVGYHIGLCAEKPKFDRYDYSEKIEYWAYLWGSIVMIITGLMMWFPAAAAVYLGITRNWVEVAAVIHYYEAWLATLAILIWHFFFVIFHPEEYPMDVSWLSGKLSVKAMEERHPLELERLAKDGLIHGDLSLHTPRKTEEKREQD